MSGQPTFVVFHAGEHKFEVSGAAAPSQATTEESLHADVNPAMASNAGTSGRFPDGVEIAAIKINGVSMRDSEVARVRFYPNGTCDELRLVLISENRESRGIFLEITTACSDVESDPGILASEITP